LAAFLFKFYPEAFLFAAGFYYYYSDSSFSITFPFPAAFFLAG
jgi:hypothetical protein